MTEISELGDFDFNTVTSTFESNLSKQQPHMPLNGLNMQSQYLYGGFHTADGELFVVERKFIGPMTGGLWLMSNAGGDLNLIPASVQSARGELVRNFTPETRHWSDHLMHKVGEDMVPEGEQGLDITIDDHNMDWNEGELLSLKGSCRAMGMQYFAPMKDRPLLYTSVPYWVKGTVMGNEVEGPVFFDHLYWTHGIEWKEYTWYKDIQVGWNVFANQYEDGSFEWGHIVQGRQGFSACVVIDSVHGVSMSSNREADFILDDNNCVASASHKVGDDVFDFTGDGGGAMLQFNRARWAGYRAQGGMTRRRGDNRILNGGFTWLECFADRIRDEGLVRN
ncbi:MAG: hypothetical protein HOE54_06300 [Gammaproteobacteria bacterium]|nr:hypothetical protein [Gammaproteobacteria bacterium]